MVYLGALIHSNGRIDAELSRRLGIATAEFVKLQKLWGHSSVSKRQKLTCFHSFVITGLLYGLSTLWTIQSQRRRLDGFYARCLRRILRIPAAYVSRVSNSAVFEHAGTLPLSQQLLQQQLVLLGRVARAPVGDPLRRDTFVGQTLKPAVNQYVRRIGRPCQNWTEDLIKQGASLWGGRSIFEDCITAASHNVWKQQVQKMFVARLISFVFVFSSRGDAHVSKRRLALTYLILSCLVLSCLVGKGWV